MTFSLFFTKTCDDVPQVAIFAENLYRPKDGQCQEMVLKIPWLTAFTSGESDINEA
jgi:hypothetical protein